jgi:hypothetical protein
MTENVQILTAILAFLSSSISAYLTYKMAQLKLRLDDVDDKLEVVHKATNSLHDEVVREVRSAAFASGAKSEREK